MKKISIRYKWERIEVLLINTINVHCKTIENVEHIYLTMEIEHAIQK